VVLSEQAHLDLPLYAVPDEDFHDQGIFSKADTHMVMDEAINFEISDLSYQELPQDRIMLALRDGNWMQSDPRKMDTWFQDAVNEHGQHLRRVSRYLKAWRDMQWPTQGDGMSSICLMACVVGSFDELGTTFDEKRDDLTLQLVATRLPDLLSRNIANPVVEELF
jgi:hypothetical protein